MARLQEAQEDIRQKDAQLIHQIRTNQQLNTQLREKSREMADRLREKDERLRQLREELETQLQQKEVELQQRNADISRLQRQLQVYNNINIIM